MYLRLLNLLLLFSLLVVGILNAQSLCQPLVDTVGWQIRIPSHSSTVAQEFQYVMPEAGEVYLVWGVDGWQKVEGEFAPPGTSVEFGVMNTPMQREGDRFVAQLQLPVGTVLTYGFQARTQRDTTAIPWTWDGETQQTLETDNLIEMQASIDLSGHKIPGATQKHPIVTPKLRPIFPFNVLLQTPSGAWLQAYYQPTVVSYIWLGLLLFSLGSLLIEVSLQIRRRMVRQGEQPLFSLHRWIYLCDLLRELVARDFKLRYKRSILGVAWSLLNPLAHLLILYFVFSKVLPLNIPNYAIFLSIGILVWTWFQSGLLAATGAIVDNPGLVRKPGFPTAILPVVAVMSQLVHFLLALLILLIIVLLGNLPVNSALLALPLVIALQFAVILSLAYILAAIYVTLRDMQYLLGVFLLLGFYISPVFYELATVPDQYQRFLRFNPMADVINAYRQILLQGQFPDVLPLLLTTLFSGGLLVVGYLLFVRASHRFIEEL